LAVAGLLTGVLAAALLLQGSPVAERGPVDVSYPAGKVKEVRVLDAVDVYVDGEPRPGFSVYGAMALMMLATAALVMWAALRAARARPQLRAFWAVAAGGLAVAGLDELLAIHESIGHNLPFLADVPGVKRPDDLVLALYLPAALAFGWWFRDVLVERRLTVACGIAAVFWFGLSVAGDLISLGTEEWFELLAGLFLAAGLVNLMYRHLQEHVGSGLHDEWPRVGRRIDTAAEREREPALHR
jgi:hypothetical protein